MPNLIPKHQLISKSKKLDAWWLRIAEKIKVKSFQKYNSCVLVNPGANREHNIFENKMSFPVEDVAYSLESYVSKDQYIIFSCWAESFTKEILEFTNAVFLKLLENGKFSQDRLIILVGSLPVRENYDQYIKLCQINNWPVFPIIFFAGYENKMFNFIAKKQEYANLEKFDYKSFYHRETKDKTFLFLNGGVRSHRTYFMLHLAKLRLLDKCLYSYITEKHELLQNVETASTDELYKEKISSVLPYLDELELPKILTLKRENVQTDGCKITDNDLELHNRTYLSIIPETTFFKYNDTSLKNSHLAHLDGIFLTEKTFRTIACKHPFIILGRPHSLKALRELGYKTYNEWIDESYDEIEDDYLRLDKIVSIIKNLSEKDHSFWVEFYRGTREIAEYNYDVLFNKNIFPFRTSYYPLNTA